MIEIARLSFGSGWRERRPLDGHSTPRAVRLKVEGKGSELETSTWGFLGLVNWCGPGVSQSGRQTRGVFGCLDVERKLVEWMFEAVFVTAWRDVYASNDDIRSSPL